MQMKPRMTQRAVAAEAVALAKTLVATAAKAARTKAAKAKNEAEAEAEAVAEAEAEAKGLMTRMKQLRELQKPGSVLVVATGVFLVLLLLAFTFSIEHR